MAKEYKRKNAILDKINELKKYGFYFFQQKRIGKNYYLTAGRPFLVIHENYLEALDELLILAKIIDEATAEYMEKRKHQRKPVVIVPGIPNRYVGKRKHRETKNESHK